MANDESERLTELGCPKDTHSYIGDGIYLGMFHRGQIIAVARHDEHSFDFISFEAREIRALVDYARRNKVIE